jgi:hypothetical protein
MSIRSEVDQMDRDRKREVAICKALAQMEEKSNPTTGAAMANNAPSMPSEAHEEIPLDIPVTMTPNHLQEKPWMRNGRQWRPMLAREREAEDNIAFDKKALADLAVLRAVCTSERDEYQAEKNAVAIRRAKELRTGMRPLPGSRADRGRTFQSTAEPRTLPASNPDNRPHSDRFGSE